jgi:MerR family transcriptional regulator, copper efflux regulator
MLRVMEGGVADEVKFQIGEVADEVGLSLRTIRHYEEIGLVLPSGRSSGGFRLYTAADIERLRLVKQLKPLEFTLDEMRELVETLDRLDDAADVAQERRALVERLSLFATIAQERCDRLREQLAEAEAWTGQLRRRVLSDHPSKARSR